jgi:DNA-binding ferritin-like protein
MIKLKNILTEKTTKKSYIPESFSATADNEYGQFIVKLLAVRDQSHIFHWQTKSFAMHKAFGKFYEEYLELIDELVESIMGLKGRPVIGNATIEITDYSPLALSEFLDKTYDTLSNHLKEVLSDFDVDEIFDQAKLILLQIDKLKYLLTLK